MNTLWKSVHTFSFLAICTANVGWAQDPILNVPKAEDFVERFASREYSGMLIVRPVQVENAAKYDLHPREVLARAQLAREILNGFDLVSAAPEVDEYVIRIPAEDNEYALAVRLMGTGAFEYAQPNWIVAPIGCPNDTLFSSQWHHNTLGSCTAWDYAQGSSSITVAVLDTGVRLTHVDLTGRKEGYNATTNSWESGGGQVNDLNGHGTMTAGLAAAKGNNSQGVSGMGWNLSFRPVRVSDLSSGFSDIAKLTAAARAAADAGDKVISVSYSGVGDPAVETAGAYVRSRGALLVWAAGNNSENHTGNRNDNVIIVGATDSANQMPSWSGRGQRLDFVAPGVNIFSTTNAGNSSYGSSSGTSFATPLVAGLCGLIFSRNPGLSPAEVENILRASALDLGAGGADDNFGYGLIRAGAALAMTTSATRTTHWATSVPNNSAWTDESYAAGAQTCDDCNSSACQYSTNSTNGNTTALTAADFENFTLPAGRRITKVELEAVARYNTATSANIGIRAFIPGGLDSGWRTTPSFTSGTTCAPRAGATGDITSLSGNWTAAMINNLQFQIRRQSNLSNNTLRVVSIRLMVTTAPL
jgi:subtilisin family serine protease